MYRSGVFVSVLMICLVSWAYADTSEDAVDGERLVRAVLTGVGDLNRAAAELAGDLRREAVHRGRQQEG